MTVREMLGEVYRRDTVLALVAWMHVALFVLMLAVAPFDGRTVTGLNPWIKPLKFAVSFAIYTATLAWFVAYLRAYRRTVRVISWGTALVAVVEMACIISQAARGVPSHFNVSNAYDGAVFGLMGLTIAFNTLLVFTTLLLFFGKTAPLPAAYLWGIRLGLLIFFLASIEGTVMVSHMSHTIGARDGGPGLLFVNWSTRAGDLRIAHFLGFHALQLMPLAGHALGRLKADWPRRLQVACMLTLGVFYLACVFLIFWQAMNGRPLLRLGLVRL